MLQRLPVDAMKLDGAFTRSVIHTPRGSTVLEAVLRLAHTLDLRTFADGVESAEQLRELGHLGCYAAQGLHIAPPMPAAAVEALPAVRRRTSARRLGPGG
jgi:EAL domain-containing protein (putative c-di-GMP-specific phosphodiesterase class I)